MEKDREYIETPLPLFGYEDPDRLRHMNEFLEGYAKRHGLVQTQAALPFAVRCHEGQFRRSRNRLPYIAHPLLMACNAAALGIGTDEVLATVLLHDTVEDCGVTKEDLPVGDAVREAVELLTFRKVAGEEKIVTKERYFRRMEKNRIACIVKLLDRCNNVSYMVDAFPPEKMSAYIDETRRFVFPLAEIVRENWPEFAGAAYTLKYHIYSVISSIEILTKDFDSYSEYRNAPPQQWAVYGIAEPDQQQA